MADPEKRREFFADKCSELLELGFDEREAYSQARKEFLDKFDVSARTFRKDTSDFRTDGEPDLELVEIKNEKVLQESKRANREKYIDKGDHIYYSPPWLDSGMLEVEKDKVDRALELYSASDGYTATLKKVMREVGWSRRMAEYIIWEAHDKNHDDNEFRSEQKMNMKPEEAAETTLQRWDEKYFDHVEDKRQDLLEEYAQEYVNIKKGFVEPLMESFEERVPVLDPVNEEIEIERKKDNCWVIPIGDAHIGSRGTAISPYNSEEVASNFLELMRGLASKSACVGKPDVIYVPFIGDFAHVDTYDGETSYKTGVQPADESSKIWEVAYNTAEYAIRELSKFGPVHVTFAEGNHDKLFTTSLRRVMRKAFSKYDNVTIDDRDYPVQSFCYGDNQFGSAHGCEVSAGEIPDVMARDYPSQWGSSTNRCAFYGHGHTEEMDNDDLKDVTLYGIPTSAPQSQHELNTGPYEGKRGVLSYHFTPEGKRIYITSEYR